MPPLGDQHTARKSLILYLAAINDVILSVSRPVCYFESLIDARCGCLCCENGSRSVHARRIRVRMCVHRWRSSQLERESGKGAISVQFALIASTLSWWAVLLPIYHCCCWFSWTEQAPRPWIELALSLHICWAHSVDLFLTCSIFAWSNISVSLFCSRYV